VKKVAEMAMKAWGGDYDGLRDWLLKIGAKDYRDLGHGAWSIVGPSGVRVGFSPSLEPTTCAIQIAIAVAGIWWPRVFPGLLEEVDRLWKAARKSQDSSSASIEILE
jgi:hypothetical protein